MKENTGSASQGQIQQHTLRLRAFAQSSNTDSMLAAQDQDVTVQDKRLIVGLKHLKNILVWQSEMTNQIKIVSILNTF